VSWHLFGIIATRFGIAANNRGETEGNITTLQKILWRGDVHTTVSAEAVRWAIRYYWQMTGRGSELNRTWNDETMRNDWRDERFQETAKYLDDDVLGYMLAEAAQREREDSEDGPDARTSRRRRPRGTVFQRRSRLELTRAVSLTPFVGDITFNAASRNATPGASHTGQDPVPYGTEAHATRYQYGFALTPESLAKPERALLVVDALCRLGDVGGNHARFLFDFSPEAVVFRWTKDPAPRILYGYAWDGKSETVACPGVIQAIETKDVDPAELVVGGAIDPGDWDRLKEHGVRTFKGVLEAAKEVKDLLVSALGLHAG
jgi:CRISPR-associated protein Cst2